jgi:hypothetical protein
MLNKQSVNSPNFNLLLVERSTRWKPEYDFIVIKYDFLI